MKIQSMCDAQILSGTYFSIIITRNNPFLYSSAIFHFQQLSDIHENKFLIGCSSTTKDYKCENSAKELFIDMQ